MPASSPFFSSARTLLGVKALCAGVVLFIAGRQFAGPGDPLPTPMEHAPAVQSVPAEDALVAKKAEVSTLANLWKAEIAEYLDDHYPDLAKHYKYLHSHPELSHQELQTSAFLIKQLEGSGFQVTKNFGGTTGLVAVLRNGIGPTVLSEPRWTPCRSRSRPACPTPARRSRETKTARSSG